MSAFCSWATQLLAGCLYPGAPYERKFFAVEALNALMEVCVCVCLCVLHDMPMFYASHAQHGTTMPAARQSQQCMKSMSQSPVFLPTIECYMSCFHFHAHVCQICCFNLVCRVHNS